MIISGTITTGNDNIIADDADDRGIDAIDALYGNDTVDGGGGADELFGSSGNDSLDGGPGMDTLDGGSEDDTLIGGENIDFLQGSIGNDSLIGDGGDDFLDADLFGSPGNDTLIAGSGADFVIGGDGDDYFYDEDVEVAENNLAGPGKDTIDYSNAPLDLISEINLTSGMTTDSTGNSETILDFEDVVGSESGETIFGSNEANRLEGIGGNDTIEGEEGDDTLLGGGGQDNLTGGIGDDTFRFYAPNQGIDHIEDFDEGNNLIEVSRRGFERATGLDDVISGRGLFGLGGLEPSQFHKGEEAQEESHRFIYDVIEIFGQELGVLYFDADGIGERDQVALATLDNAPDLFPVDINVDF